MTRRLEIAFSFWLSVLWVAVPLVSQAAPPADTAGVQWLRVPFEKAENEILAIFQRDFSRLEKASTKLAVYEVKVSGELPQNYSKNFRSKLERVLMTSSNLRVKQCAHCDQSRIYRSEDGQIRYESQNQDRGRMKRISKELDVSQLLFAELIYSTSDLALEVRLVNASSDELLWMGSYSTADVTKTRKDLISREKGYEVGQGDSLARVLIGEVAFTTVFAPGVMWLPVNNGGHAFYPAIDLLLGEKYNSGYNRFGFVIGVGASITKDANAGPLPFLARVAPHFRHTFNPFTMSTVQYSITGELGAMIGTGLVTAYLGLGLEMAMIKRFSLSLVPFAILPADIGGSMTQVQQPDGTFVATQGSKLGSFGGVGGIMKLNINW